MIARLVAHDKPPTTTHSTPYVTAAVHNHHHCHTHPQAAVKDVIEKRKKAKEATATAGGSSN